MAWRLVIANIPEHKIVNKWRLQPGKMLLVDLEEHRIISDEELKSGLANAYPYQDWLDRTQIHLKSLPREIGPMTPDADTLLDMQQSFGYTREDLKFFLDPMAEKEDPIGSMGRDIPLASSRKSRGCFTTIFSRISPR